MARKKTPRQIAALPRDEHLKAKLADLEEFLASPDAKRNGAAYVAGTRLAATLRAELDELTRPPPVAPEGVDPAAGLTDDELVAGIVEAIDALPDVALDAVESALTRRRTGKPKLAVVE